jgi:S1-C subfamily serine protease
MRCSLPRSIIGAAVLVAVGVVNAVEAQEQDATSQDATVLVRVWGELSQDLETNWSQAGETKTVEVATGTGFFVSPSGYILADHHVVTGQVPSLPPTEDSPDITGIEVVVKAPEEEGGGERSYEATLVTQEPELGLALLVIVPDRDMPYAFLGDSDVLTEGQSVSAWGFAKRGRGSADLRSPTTSLRVRAISSRVQKRSMGHDGGLAAFEMAASLSPAYSGGPIVDAEGYVVGVSLVRPTEGGTAGWGVPVNLVKTFLEAMGLASELPPRLWLGPQQQFGWKGLRFQPLEGITDLWPGRTRWESWQEIEGVSLRIDRVASSLSLGELEARLLSGTSFGGFAASRVGGKSDGAARTIPRSQTRILGSARGVWDGIPYATEYTLLNLRNERILARYDLPADMAAYNRSVLRKSLESLQASQFLMHPVSKTLEADMEPVQLPDPGAPIIPMPKEWTRESLLDESPATLPSPDSALSASPSSDYTVSFNAFWWHAAPQGAQGIHGSYESRAEVHGEAHTFAGDFLEMDGGLLLLECRAPAEKQPFIQELCTAWKSAVTTPQ